MPVVRSKGQVLTQACPKGATGHVAGLEGPQSRQLTEVGVGLGWGGAGLVEWGWCWWTYIRFHCNGGHHFATIPSYRQLILPHTRFSLGFVILPSRATVMMGLLSVVRRGKVSIHKISRSFSLCFCACWKVYVFVIAGPHHASKKYQTTSPLDIHINWFTPHNACILL